MDGYKLSIFNMDQNQISCDERRCVIDNEIEKIALEIDEMPTVPASMEEWITSWGDSNPNTFGLNNFKKRFEIKKELDKLMEYSDSNYRELKVIKIDELLLKIDKILQSE